MNHDEAVGMALEIFPEATKFPKEKSTQRERDALLVLDASRVKYDSATEAEIRDRYRTGKCTLGEHVYNLVSAGQQESEEFKTLIRFFGRDHLLARFQEFKTYKRGRA